MATITDNDLKMFQERARTELASGCDVGGIAWDIVIKDLCNEVRRLRSVPKERGDCAKLREALHKAADSAAEIMERVRHKDGLAFNLANYISGVAKEALASPPRNCDIAQDWLRDLYVKFKPPASIKREMPPEWVDAVMAFCRWLLAPAKEKEGGKDAD